ncbi:MAG TPA: protein YgfX [Casimicrobiaceae bacterium]|nr:protein YgfX [Casimicrobiaceae bacterium]
MRTPNQLRVPLRPSRTLLLAIPVVAGGAFASWLSISAPLWSDAIVALMIVCWMVDAIRRHGWRTSRSAVVEVLLSGDAVVVVRLRSGELIAGHVRAASFIHPLVTTIVWRPDDALFSRTFPIVPDMIDVDDFRRLRVLLRYGRREVAAGAPARHA